MPVIVPLPLAPAKPPVPLGIVYGPPTVVGLLGTGGGDPQNWPCVSITIDELVDGLLPKARVSWDPGNNVTQTLPPPGSGPPKNASTMVYAPPPPMLLVC